MVALVVEMNCSHTVFNRRSTWERKHETKEIEQWTPTSFLESLSCSWTPGLESRRNSSKALFDEKESKSALYQHQL